MQNFSHRNETTDAFFFIMALFTKLHNTIHQQPTVQELQEDFFHVMQYVTDISLLPAESQQEIINLFSGHIPFLQQTYQKAEALLEKLYAKEVLADKAFLTHFLNQRYKRIIHSEFELFDRFSERKKKRWMLFCGGGALPISPILMALKDEDITIHVLDSDPEAISLSQQIIKTHRHHLPNLHILPSCPIEEYPWLNEYDIISLAAMVGEDTENKITIYRTIARQLHPKSILYTRSSDKNKCSELLYAPFPIEKLHNLYNYIYFNRMHPLVNISHVVLQRK